MASCGCARPDTITSRFWPVILMLATWTRFLPVSPALWLVRALVRGFGGVSTRRRSDLEEIDLVIPNESPDPVWQKEGSYLLGECKNWSSRVGRDEFDAVSYTHLTLPTILLV